MRDLKTEELVHVYGAGGKGGNCGCNSGKKGTGSRGRKGSGSKGHKGSGSKGHKGSKNRGGSKGRCW